MKRVMYLSVFAALLFVATGNSFGQSNVKETRNVTGFSEIGFGIAGSLYIKIGPEFSVVLEGDKKYLSEIETVVRNGRLVVKTENFRFFNNERADVYITLPELKGLGVSGSGTAQIESNIKTDVLDFSVSGSGKIMASEIEAGEMNCSISGSGDIVLKGKGEISRGDINISGSGNYSGAMAVIKNIEIRISGSGKCDCFASESLNASVSGSGDIYYSGNPKVNARTSGSGHIRSK